MNDKERKLSCNEKLFRCNYQVHADILLNKCSSLFVSRTFICAELLVKILKTDNI